MKNLPLFVLAMLAVAAAYGLIALALLPPAPPQDDLTAYRTRS
jgi:hypothetical protein